MAEKDKAFLEGLAISAACHVLPVRKVYGLPEEPPVPDEPVTGDILDNEWPITWKMSEVEGNTQYDADGDPAILVSNIIPTAEELAGITAVAVINGETQELQLVADVVTLGQIAIAVYASNDETIMLALNSIGEIPDGFPYPTTGLFYAVFDETNSDIQFTLTKGGS